MLNSLPLFVGLRYVRARSHKFFVSFITWVSLLCVCLGVMALIVILSVMNGLEGELRERLLALSSHARIYRAVRFAGHRGLARAGAEQCAHAPNVAGAAPFIEIEALAVRKPEMLPVRLRGIDPAHEGEVERVTRTIVEGKLADLTPGSDRVIVGRAHRADVGPWPRRSDHAARFPPPTRAVRRSRACGNSSSPACSTPRCRTTTVRLLIAALDDVRALLPIRMRACRCT